MSDLTLLGVGQIALDGRIIENPTTFELTLEKEEFTLPNLGTPGGGEYVKKSRIKSIGFSATVHDYSADTLSRFLSGDASAVATASIADDPMIARDGRLVATANLIDTDQTVTVDQNAATRFDSTAYVVGDWIFEGAHLYLATVAGTSAATPPTFQTDGTDTTDGGVTWADKGVFAAVSGADFIASAAGIRFVAGGGIPDNAPVKVSYTSHDVGVVEIGTKIALDIPVIFDGWNDESNKPMVGNFYKVAIDNDGGIPLITEGYGGATMTGSILIDSSQPAGKSKFGKLSIGGVAVL